MFVKTIHKMVVIKSGTKLGVTIEVKKFFRKFAYYRNLKMVGNSWSIKVIKVVVQFQFKLRIERYLKLFSTVGNINDQKMCPYYSRIQTVVNMYIKMFVVIKKC